LAIYHIKKSILVLYHAKKYVKNDKKLKFDENLMKMPFLLNKKP